MRCPGPTGSWPRPVPFRRSPLHHLLAAKGAVFGSKMGWERPNVFAPERTASLGSTTPGTGPIGCPGLPRNRPRPASASPSSTRPPSASSSWSAGTPRRCCSACARPTSECQPGRAVYTGMLNERAGYEADVTVTRLAPDRYLLVTSAASPVRDAAWIERHLRVGEHVSVVDVSSAFAVLGVMGPASRELLGRLGSADLSDDAFPFSTSREIALGYATVRATRITYVGEFGWELYVPPEFAIGVYEDLLGAGSDLGLVDAGYYAMNSLRLDKGYRAFGSDLTPDYTPVEAGLRFTCKLATPIDFVGRTSPRGCRCRRPSTAPGLVPAPRSRPHAVGRRARPARRCTGRAGRAQPRGRRPAGRRSGSPTSGDVTADPSGPRTWPRERGR